MKNILFNCLLIIISLAFFGCPTHAPATDPTPPIISININGEGINETFQTILASPVITVPSASLNLHQSRTYTITAIASDIAVERLQMEFPNDLSFLRNSDNGYFHQQVLASSTIVEANNYRLPTPLNAMYFIGTISFAPTFRAGEKVITFSSFSETPELGHHGSVINLKVFLQPTPY
jgi:hypothetical protein